MAENLNVSRVRELLAEGPRLTSAGKAGIRYVRDGGTQGLYLRVSAVGRGSWVYRYRRKGRLRELGLGKVAIFGKAVTPSVDGARKAAKAAAVKLDNDIDPIEEKRTQAVQEAARETNTFDQVAERFIAAKESGWRNGKHRQQWRNTLKLYASPILGGMDVSEIGVSDVEKALEPIWQTKPETARRVRGRVESVLDYATAKKLRTGENPARLKVLNKVLPEQHDQVVHHDALPYADAPAFMAALRMEEGFGARGLELLILCASRTQEVNAARWEEFDLDAGLWHIPAARMKGKGAKRKPHTVTLSSAAIKLLEELPRLDDEYVFPSTTRRRRGEPMDKDAMAATLRRMKKAKKVSAAVTVHGMRATFKTWAVEKRPEVPDAVSEACLAHSLPTAVLKAYNRAKFMEMRRELLESWAEYLIGERATIWDAYLELLGEEECEAS